MTGRNDQSDPLIDPRSLSVAARLRAAADGEVVNEPASPDEATRIDFERALRASCARAMQGNPAPEDVRRRVLLAMRAENAPSLRLAPTAAEGSRETDGPIPFPRRWSWLNVGLAMAAVVAMSVAGLLMMNTPSSPVMFGEARATILADFANAQHQECADFGPKFEGKMTARTPAEAQKAAIELLSHVPEVLEFKSEALEKAGYKFAGLGRCHVPGKGRSAHLMYKPDVTIAPAAPIISLFVQEDTGEYALDDFCAYRKQGDPEKKRCCMTVWRRDGLIYYLVTPKGTPDAAREAFAVPEREELL